MKAVILAGGFGTRFSEETINKPKPMIELGDLPIIVHIMKIYSNYNINDFIICTGYKSNYIKNYFINYLYYQSNIEIDMNGKDIHLIDKIQNNWRVQIIFTGINTMTGGRIKRLKNYLSQDEDFCLTYGDGLSDINISKLINHHRKSNKVATLTAVKQNNRFGVLNLNKNNVINFEEKPRDDYLINGGFFVFNKKIFNYLSDDATVLEQEPLKRLAKENELNAFKHNGFWHAMDNLRDYNYLKDLWDNNKAPWKIWD